MIKSMTAYGSAEISIDPFTVSAEIRTFNGRYLDIQIRLAHGYASMEEQIRSLISRQLTRGRVEITIQIHDASDPDYEIEIDMPRVKAYKAAAERLRAIFPDSGELSMDFLLSQGGIMRVLEAQKDSAACWSVVQKCMEHAMENLNAMRKKEGDFIVRDFLERLTYIEKKIEQIKTASTDLLPHYREQLKGRISALTEGIVEIDNGRIAQEAAFIADRSDISEEIVRAESHLKQFRDIMKAPEPSGRKLNFLLQEFTREFNTMGVKAGNAKVSHMVVSVKAELEKLREQVQNVE
ncbi:MAG TPA: YicC family protein [Desulfobacterales bacterium]|nr:YicC family protein [Desulfobacterales bacterium]